MGSVPPVRIERDSLEPHDRCKVRHIGKTGIETPLLVPAFSSTAFPNAADVRLAIEAMKPQLAISSLISAFDVDHQYVGREVAVSDLVIVDSGNYEMRVLEGLGCSANWTREKHETTIDSLVPLTQVAIVNYDEAGPLEGQVSSASSFFDRHPQYATDFLFKPLSSNESYVDVLRVEKDSELLRKFDIIGVTEKELGSSLVQRCRNLARLRQCLGSISSDIPIHVFGCFEPATVVLMSICGGDIFDGLTWARYALHEGVLVYGGSIPWLGEDWSIDDSTLQRAAASENLRQMSRLMFRLRRFATSKDCDDLELKREVLDFIKSIVTTVDEEFG